MRTSRSGKRKRLWNVPFSIAQTFGPIFDGSAKSLEESLSGLCLPKDEPLPSFDVMKSAPMILATLALFYSPACVADEVAVKLRQFPRVPEHSIQGMCITEGGLLIQGYDGGLCRIYDLNKTDDNAPVAEFRFGSAGKNNHANALSLGTILHDGEEIPRIYVTGGQPSNGMMECHVEVIRKDGGTYRAKRVQRISLASEFAWDMAPSSSPRTNDGFVKIWGAPSWLVDEKSGALYIFSAIYRTLPKFSAHRQQNRYIVTKLRLPDVSEGDITLTRKDVIEQKEFPFDAFVTQSGYLAGREIYYTFGFGRASSSLASSQIRAYDLDSGRISRSIDLEKAIPEELESCAFYKGNFHVMTQKGNLYQIQFPEK
jgi:hypothetical protein